MLEGVRSRGVHNRYVSFYDMLMEQKTTKKENRAEEICLRNCRKIIQLNFDLMPYHELAEI